MKEFEVTTWDNGNPDHVTGSGLGLRVRPADRDAYFKRIFKEVMINLEGRKGFILVNIDKESFWNECSELICNEIGNWMIENGYDKWQFRKPHKLKLSFLKENIFYLKK